MTECLSIAVHRFFFHCTTYNSFIQRIKKSDDDANTFVFMFDQRTAKEEENYAFCINANGFYILNRSHFIETVFIK